MIRKTEQNFAGQSLRQTMVQSMKALGGREVPNYTLLYLDPTSDKKRGDYQAIVVPYIEIGRSADCVIQYGDNYPTVSRKQAALSWEGNEIILKHLGKNPTIVNGTPIQDKWFLRNGDEIQFAIDGPKIRFNATPTKTSTMKFTERFNEFSQQALRPYRKAVMVLSLLILSVSGYAIYSQFKNNKEMAQLNQNLVVYEDSLKLINAKLSNASSSADRKLLAMKNSLESRIRSLKVKAGSSSPDPVVKAPDVNSTPTSGSSSQPQPEPTSQPVNASASGEDIADELKNKFESYVYFVNATRYEITYPKKKGKTVQIKNTDGFYSGTGFLTSDGKFVTSRHIVQPWVFEPAAYGYSCDKMKKMSDIFLTFNKVIRSGGKVIIYFKARSSSNDRFEFSSEKMVFNDAQDSLICGGKYKTIRKNNYGSDWAYLNKGNRESPIKIDMESSRHLKQGENLFAYGYTSGKDLQDEDGTLQPLFGGASSVSQKGIINGLVNVSNSGMGHGMSGGPLFYKKNGNWVVVGVACATSENATLGHVVPVGNIE